MSTLPHILLYITVLIYYINFERPDLSFYERYDKTKSIFQILGHMATKYQWHLEKFKLFSNKPTPTAPVSYTHLTLPTKRIV